MLNSESYHIIVVFKVKNYIQGSKLFLVPLERWKCEHEKKMTSFPWVISMSIVYSSKFLLCHTFAVNLTSKLLNDIRIYINNTWLNMILILISTRIANVQWHEFKIQGVQGYFGRLH